MASSDTTTVDVTRLEAEYKKDKARVKSNFSRARGKITSLLEDEALPSRRDVLDACRKMDSCSEIATDVLTNFAEFYIRIGEVQKSMRVSNEIEKMDEEYSAAYETAREYLESRQDYRSTASSDILSIDMLQTGRMNISDTRQVDTDTPAPENQTLVKEVGAFISNNDTVAIASAAHPGHLHAENQVDNSSLRVASNDQVHLPTTEHENQLPGPSSNTDNSMKSLGISGLNARANSFEPTPTQDAPSLGQDLWRQLKRVQIPIFSGDKRTYPNWRAAFQACVDSAPATPEYKLLQLRQYLSGEALQSIENLGHSAVAYDAAKERLDRKFGGKRRQIAVYLEDLENFKQIRPGNAKDLEKFADLLDVAIINLKEAGQNQELGDGSLYNKLQRKLSESMLAQYHRWVFENNITESVASLRKWVIQEAEFQIIASETMHGLKGKPDSQQPTSSFPIKRNPRTFFGESKTDCNTDKNSCQVCRGQHAVWRCRAFSQKTPADRWNIAKRLQLCFRCLGEGHYGKLCPSSRMCGKNGCQENHHRLLHQRDRTAEVSPSSTPSNTEPKRIIGDQTERDTSSEDEADSLTEGKEQPRIQHTTMVTQSIPKTDFIALRTVPVVLKNGDRFLKVNALLDEASTKTYLNADVAAELGLQGRTEKVTVNVLNGQIETFETKPVSFELLSVDQKVNMNVTAYTTNRVTGDMPVVNWNEYSSKWPYLTKINFPVPAKKPIIDILIGLDCLDLHCSTEEVRGRPGEPVARLTPLGWTCVGNPYNSDTPILQTHFAYTYFMRDQSEIQQLNVNLKRFWEIEETPSVHSAPIVQIHEQCALKKVKNSLEYDNAMYRIGVPWIDSKPILPDNYRMALQRLQNTEKRLQKSPDVAMAYSDIIDKYVAKGYVRKVQDTWGMVAR